MSSAAPCIFWSFGFAVSALSIADAAFAQVGCGQPAGPDVIAGDITAVANYASSGGIEAFSLGPVTCNIGTAPANTVATTPNHPAVAMNLFRLKMVDAAARFEQIGQGWVFHEITSLEGSVCCQSCSATPDGNTLGVRCSSPDSASFAGTQSMLGPKYQINPVTGVFPFPPASPPWSGTVARRLQARISDIDPAQDGGGSYLVELQMLAADDASAGNALNNASYRSCFLSGAGTSWNLNITGTTQRQMPAIRAWQAADPAVVERDILVPGDGLFILAARATDLGGGQWRYEYALHNLNSDRAAQSFSIPLPAGVTVSNVGFHDVDYHDGDGLGNVNFDGTDWPSSVAGGAIIWSTADYAASPSANALRWGTLYNFRFDADAPPLPAGASATIGLFKPGAPASIASGAVTVPARTCPASPDGDINADGLTDGRDVARLVDALVAGSMEPSDLCRADFSADGVIDEPDVPGFVGSALSP